VSYNVEFILDWVVRMNEKWGHTVHGDAGEYYDWGQALCHEIYGKKWGKHPAFLEVNDSRDIPTVAVETAKRLESAEQLPEWIVCCTGKAALP
jgi:hypothetical protein